MTDTYRIFVPEIPRLDEVEDQPYVRIKAAYSLLRRAFPEAGYHQVSPAYCGWYHLWWRVWDCVTSIPGCYSGDAKFALRSLTRAAQEVGLHAALITQVPVTDAGSTSARGAERLVGRRIKNRYKGYLAWILHNELRGLQAMLDPEHLDAAFEAQTAREHAADLRRHAHADPGVLEIFPEPETFTDAEADRDRAQAQEALEGQCREVSWLLRSPELRPWREVLEAASPKFMALETLLDLQSDRHHSVSGGFRRIGIPAGVVNYQHQSSRIHGSSWSAALRWTDTAVLPNGAFFEDTTELVDSAIAAAMWAATSLAFFPPPMSDEPVSK